MKNLFYLNFIENEYLKKKCSIKRFIKGLERPAGANEFLTLDCNGQTSVNNLKGKKKTIFFNTNFAVKVRFSRQLFIQSFLLTHQKSYVDFAQKYQENIRMLRNINFCTMLILKIKKGGYLVRAAGFICFLPRRSYRRLFSRIAETHFMASIGYQLRVLLVFLLKISFKLGAGLSVFSTLCRKVCFERVLKKPLVLNNGLLSNRLPFKQHFSCHLPTEYRIKMLFKFKQTSSYFKKKFRNKRRLWRGRVRFVLYLKSFKSVRAKKCRKKKKKLKIKNPVFSHIFNPVLAADATDAS